MSASSLPVLLPGTGSACQCASLQKQVSRLRVELEAAEATAKSALKLTRISEQDLEEAERQAHSARVIAKESASAVEAERLRAEEAVRKAEQLEQELGRLNHKLAYGNEQAVAAVDEEKLQLQSQMQQMQTTIEGLSADLDSVHADLRSSRVAHTEELSGLRRTHMDEHRDRERAAQELLEQERIRSHTAEEKHSILERELEALKARTDPQVAALQVQVEELRTQLATAEADRDRFRSELTNVLDDMTTAQSDASHWRAAHASLEKEVGMLRQQVSQLQQEIQEVRTSQHAAPETILRAVSDVSRLSEVFDTGAASVLKGSLRKFDTFGQTGEGQYFDVSIPDSDEEEAGMTASVSTKSRPIAWQGSGESSPEYGRQASRKRLSSQVTFGGTDTRTFSDVSSRRTFSEDASMDPTALRRESMMSPTDSEVFDTGAADLQALGDFMQRNGRTFPTMDGIAGNEEVYAVNLIDADSEAGALSPQRLLKTSVTTINGRLSQGFVDLTGDDSSSESLEQPVETVHVTRRSVGGAEPFSGPQPTGSSLRTSRSRTSRLGPSFGMLDEDEDVIFTMAK